MADSYGNKSPQINNEDLINELTKDLEASLVTSDSNDNSSSSSNTDNNRQSKTETNSMNDNTTHPDFQFKNEIPSKETFDAENFDKDESEPLDVDSDEEDLEMKLKDDEVTLTDEEKQVKKLEAENYKNLGNDKFKNCEFEESIKSYTEGLKICPLAFNKDRAILYSNRAASKMKLNKNKEAIKDCTKAIENDDTYIKAYYRRAQCYEQTDSLDESLADYKKILEFDPQHSEAKKGVVRLPPRIEERNEKMKTEMISKLKDLGNLVLKPFGLSTDNFNLVQDPETKGYSINFQQNK